MRIPFNKYKERFKKYCEYSSSVENTTLKIYNILPEFIISDDYLRYACIFLYISKIIEDNILCLDDFCKISGFEKETIKKNEYILFSYFLLKSPTYLNLPTFTGLGVKDSVPEEVNNCGGVGRTRNIPQITSRSL